MLCWELNIFLQCIKKTKDLYVLHICFQIFPLYPTTSNTSEKHIKFTSSPENLSSLSIAFTSAAWPTLPTRAHTNMHIHIHVCIYILANAILTTMTAATHMCHHMLIRCCVSRLLRHCALQRQHQHQRRWHHFVALVISLCSISHSSVRQRWSVVKVAVCCGGGVRVLEDPNRSCL